jgi:hypothetical protein
MATRGHDRAQSSEGEIDPDEQNPLWQANVKAHNERCEEEMKAAWCEYHQGQAARHRAVLEALIARHEREARKLMDVRPEGAA